ncbi:glycosyltransferase [Polaribacter sp. Asnod1-A03]|uniref:CgeB family protein n=1 Tax=Polaribacter sp. Asnod1-A03 TaxID=3160581 RepID=UPI003864DDED
MRILYIGQYSDGTTSKMRADQLKEIVKAEEFVVIDTHVPFYKTAALWRSFGFRFKIGPLITSTNAFIKQELENQEKFDLIWVDKGVFVSEKITKKLRESTPKLVHFTPDMAFYENESKMFYKAMYLYDFVITTKSPEKEEYLKRVKKDRLIITTQGFSKENHTPKIEFVDKENSIAFIGLAEPNRFKMMEAFLTEGIKINVAGFGWEKFVEKHKDNTLLTFAGKKLMNEEYSKFISKSVMAWGALSKKFPEQHTTRTFEIPACKTALLTEYNQEIASFYKDDEVVFYNSEEELIEKIKYLFKNKKELKNISERGYKRVNEGGYYYKAILKELVLKVLK